MNAVNLPGSLYFSADGGDALPHGPRDGLIALQGILPLEHGFAPGVIGLPPLPLFTRSWTLSPELRLEQIRIGLGDHRGQAEILGVVGHDQEVLGPLQARCARPCST